MVCSNFFPRTGVLVNGYSWGYIPILPGFFDGSPSILGTLTGVPQMISNWTSGGRVVGFLNGQLDNKMTFKPTRSIDGRDIHEQTRNLTINNKSWWFESNPHIWIHMSHLGLISQAGTEHEFNPPTNLVMYFHHVCFIGHILPTWCKMC